MKKCVWKVDIRDSLICTTTSHQGEKQICIFSVSENLGFAIFKGFYCANLQVAYTHKMIIFQYGARKNVLTSPRIVQIKFHFIKWQKITKKYTNEQILLHF